jgi:succinate dehydrogenase / fumarate reductase flavoprotein subunit
MATEILSSWQSCLPETTDRPTYELNNLVLTGRLVAEAALIREESRGAHFREDYPQRDDRKFLQHSLASYSPDGINLEYKPVAVTMFEPLERKY